MMKKPCADIENSPPANDLKDDAVGSELPFVHLTIPKSPSRVEKSESSVLLLYNSTYLPALLEFCGSVISVMKILDCAKLNAPMIIVMITV